MDALRENDRATHYAWCRDVDIRAQPGHPLFAAGPAINVERLAGQATPRLASTV